MRHETALKRLDELDAGQEPGLALRMHLAGCSDCARIARLSAEAMAAYRATDPDLCELLDERIMAAVRLTPPPRLDFAIRDWVLPGAVLLLSICLMPLGSRLGFLEAIFGPGSALSLALVLGIGFSAYSAFFIGTHLEELQGYLRKLGVTLH